MQWIQWIIWWTTHAIHQWCLWWTCLRLITGIFRIWTNSTVKCTCLSCHLVIHLVLSEERIILQFLVLIWKLFWSRIDLWIVYFCFSYFSYIWSYTYSILISYPFFHHFELLLLGGKQIICKIYINWINV